MRMRPAFLVPFRDREEHLRISAPILKENGQVYVIEQMDEKGFNLGKLINCAFLEFKNEFDYFIIHDCDTIPEDVDYSYSIYPTHLGTQVEKFGYKLPYPKFFGTVILMPNEHFEAINGYDNDYWYWGGEDDALRKRLEAKNIPIESRQCRFRSLPHESNIDHEKRMINLARLQQPIDWSNGLSSCEYDIIHCEDFDDYTLLQVKL